jgi:hypothetical protein
MPVSDVNNIAPILSEVARLNPRSILDLGIGFGKYGVLCREVLEGVHGRCDPRLWNVRIEGVEGFEVYRNYVWAAYDRVHVEDFREHYTRYKDFDLVLMIDSLEHCEAEDSHRILSFLLSANKNVIVSVPKGVCPQGAVFGNELERHRSVWNSAADFAQYRPRVLHNGVCLVMSMQAKT